MCDLRKNTARRSFGYCHTAFEGNHFKGKCVLLDKVARQQIEIICLTFVITVIKAREGEKVKMANCSRHGDTYHEFHM